jgi:hypothetical protein
MTASVGSRHIEVLVVQQQDRLANLGVPQLDTIWRDIWGFHHNSEDTSSGEFFIG